MRALTWQKSSYCPEGNSCIHIAATLDRRIHLTESADPTGAILTTTRAAFATLLATLKRQPAPDGRDEPTAVYIRSETTVVTTDRRKWNAFVLGVQAGEFDHFTVSRYDR
ncbi:DUF397 domain-containing protein [Streptomyces hyaluromycini]|uniref:DUF397 domain-containing protein n=1 Tax=Streptomyces hyaluromycini TaxID=1377993 RepID=UPI000B5CF5E0|nr:DUF397 domain-containing protein [Streptomyces hyaluromycini]